MNNYLKTAILLAGMTAMFMGFGYMLGGQSGMMIAFLIALGMNFFAYWNSDKIVLRMYRAQLLDESHWLHQMVAELATRAEIPTPKVYIADNPQPNAFATGRNPEHGAVCATSGILEILDRDELAGVMAHELAHIKNRDTLTMTITATIAGAISMLANMAMFMGGSRNGERPNPIAMIALSILAPLAAGLVQMAISRTREYSADKTGAEICGNPMALARALEKIHNYSMNIDNWQAEKNPQTAHMFIINPLHANKMDNLFSTHPNTQNRINALAEIAGTMVVNDNARDDGSPWSRPSSNRGPWG